MHVTVSSEPSRCLSIFSFRRLTQSMPTITSSDRHGSSYHATGHVISLSPQHCHTSSSVGGCPGTQTRGVVSTSLMCGISGSSDRVDSIDLKRLTSRLNSNISRLCCYFIIHSLQPSLLSPSSSSSPYLCLFNPFPLSLSTSPLLLSSRGEWPEV
ncbi:hypothetical protein GBAR_LOCUS1226 [Geodia barretti]|uniref:Uncharacterized protein n=1 Tax=Geodia barretti TaxID=519541 RepID=A0AA35QV26_GEOBA|nr:hypothetical protein GBAR_LOCUS1226 [Geodia barretti]